MKGYQVIFNTFYGVIYLVFCSSLYWLGSAWSSQITVDNNINHLLRQFEQWYVNERPQKYHEVLAKMLKIAPEHQHTIAIQALIAAEQAKPEMTKQRLFMLALVNEQHPWIDKIASILRLKTTDKSKLLRAKSLAKGGQVQAALVLMGQLFNGTPPTAALSLLYWQTLAVSDVGYQRALAGFKALAERHPYKLNFKLAWLAHRLSRLPFSNSDLEQIIALTQYPDLAYEATNIWKNALEQLALNPQNKSYFEQFLALHPGDKAVEDRLNQLLREVVFRKKHQNNPHYIAKNKGLRQLERGRNKQAKRSLLLAIKGFPQDIDIIQGIAYSALRLGQHDDANQYFKQAAQLQPSQKSFWLSLAETARYWGTMAHINRAIDAKEFTLAEKLIGRILPYIKEINNTALKKIQIIEAQADFPRAISLYQSLLQQAPNLTQAQEKFIQLLSLQDLERTFQQHLLIMPISQQKKLAKSIAQAKSSFLFNRTKRAYLAGQALLAEDYWQRAIAADPSNFDLIQWADSRLWSDDEATALSFYQIFLQHQPNDVAAHLRVMQILAEMGQQNTLLSFVDQLPASVAHAQAQKISTILVNFFLKRAQSAPQQKQAIAYLEQALAYNQQDPWLTLDLARAFQANQHLAGGKQAFQQLISRQNLQANDGNQGEAAYAFAIFLSSINEDADAYQRLSATTLFSEAAFELKEQLQVNLALQALSRLSAKAKIQHLLQIQGIIRSKRQQLRIANQWSVMGQNKPALEILNGLKIEDNKADFELRLTYIEVLQSAQAWQQAQKNLYQQIKQAKLKSQHKSQLLQLYHAHFSQQNAVFDQKLYNFVLAQGEKFVQQHPDNLPIRIAQVTLMNIPVAVALIPPQQRLTAYRALLKLDPHNISQTIAYLKLLQTQGVDIKQQYWLANLGLFEAASAGDKATLARQLIQLDALEVAGKLIDNGLKQVPEQAALLEVQALLAQQTQSLDFASYQQRAITARRLQILSGSLADDASEAKFSAEEIQQWSQQISLASPAGNSSAERFEQALNEYAFDDWKVRNLQSSLADDSRQHNGHLLIGFDWYQQGGAVGKSKFTMLTVPIELKLPFYKGGHWFARIEPVYVDAGTVEPNSDNAATFGALVLCQPQCEDKKIAQQQLGYSVVLGIEKGHWQADIGTTPLGFAVEDLVGGIKYSGDLSQAYWSVELSKRPLNSTLLSLAGTLAPFLGKTFGGVRSLGVNVGLGYDQGEFFGIWSSFGYHQFTGKNLADNQRLRAMGGAYFRIIRTEPFSLTLGSTLLTWHYQDDFSEFTFGQGGYYSPQSYVSISTPVEIFGRINNWSYSLEGRPAFSFSRNKDEPFFPNDADLQTLAEAGQNISGTRPIFSDDSGSGFSFSFKAALEYKLSRHWRLGAFFEIQRAEFFQPDNGMLYIKYYFNNNYEKVPSPPLAPIIYTNF